MKNIESVEVFLGKTTDESLCLIILLSVRKDLGLLRVMVYVEESAILF